jgi:hypothetical protein
MVLRCDLANDRIGGSAETKLEHMQDVPPGQTLGQPRHGDARNILIQKEGWQLRPDVSDAVNDIRRILQGRVDVVRREFRVRLDHFGHGSAAGDDSQDIADEDSSAQDHRLATANAGVNQDAAV